MDRNISVTCIGMTLAAAAGTLTLLFVALGVIHMRFTGIGLAPIGLSVALYVRKVNALARSREDAAYRLGRISGHFEPYAAESDGPRLHTVR